MGQVGQKGEQSTTTEITTLTNLNALGNSASGEFVRKTAPTTFENATPSGGSSLVVTAQEYTTTGGVQTITLNNTPDTVLLVTLNGGSLTLLALDYSVSGSGVTLLNSNIPVGLFGRILYSH